jgi:hypothetical protein
VKEGQNSKGIVGVMPRAWVVVLGDVGRSPRMQYHTSSLCKTVGIVFVAVHIEEKNEGKVHLV